MKEDILYCETCRHNVCTRRIPLFSSLDEDNLRKIIGIIKRKHFKKGELLIGDKTILDSLIIISRGKIKIFRITHEGKEQILYIFSEGDFFGEKNLIRNRLTNYNIEALEDSSFCMIHKDDFQEIIHEHPQICVKVMEELCTRLDRFENAVENMGTKNVDARISSVLIEFSEKYGKPYKNGIMINLPLTREGIANYIGVTRETVSRKLSSFQDKGYIEMIGNKKILVKDRVILEEFIQ